MSSAEDRKAEIESGNRPSMDAQNFGGYHGWNSGEGAEPADMQEEVE